ncbi:hypothetical protein [Caldilinea sp.]|jgi:hypothetical protein|uniref:hypothetical protein n=1 Tax=Caldilinea sp. TaxID=2293560 RepID=UPI0021DCCBD7|nr:hypothetical protein [Caldilinea sp.]GIV69469.1 MAG: hypothetical protein KatS3mg048_2331 [Caldilinea sp.]
MFENPWFSWGMTALLALVATAWLATNLQGRKRNRALASGFEESTRSRLVYARGVSMRGFAARFEPAPEPFIHLEVAYRSGATPDPLGFLIGALTRQNDELTLRALLPDRPVAELIWERGRIPALARARRARASLWVHRRSELIGGEYAVRGPDAAALEYVFVDLQARFGHALRRVHVAADREDAHVEVTLQGSSLRRSDAPALVATVRSLGRAATRR